MRRLMLMAFCATWAAALNIGDAAQAPPNVVFILADDLGYGDLGCYEHPYAKTPNIDRLAEQGTLFRQFYVTGVTCCPSRTGFMTSRFPASYRTYPANGGFGDHVTVTQLLKNRGYHTGHFGKWHIGPDVSPGTYGIDAISDAAARERKRNDPRGRDARIFDDAISFIEEHRAGPFYVNVWCHIPHHPVDPSQAYVDKLADVTAREADFADYMHEKFAMVREGGGDPSDRMRRYLADIYSLDEDVGRLLAKLDELDLGRNTIVVFSSDNGPAPMRIEQTKKRDRDHRTTELRYNAMGYAGGLRGGKHEQFEGGFRMPFIVRWPGHVPSGRVDADSVTSGIDWLPTLCAIAGIEIKPDEFAGEDVSAAWLGGTHVRQKPLVWKTSSPTADLAIRDGQWKLHLPLRKNGCEVQLYNLAADPAERRNLAADHPDVVERLSARLTQWNATLPTEYLKTNDKQD